MVRRERVTHMDRKNQLLNRLESIGRSLEKTDQALMLLGLGSGGAERDRLDNFSDLDFFVIAKDGYKERFIRNVDWLEAVCPRATLRTAFSKSIPGTATVHTGLRSDR